MLNFLIRGNPLDPHEHDLIAQLSYIDVGDPVPDGWRVLSGSTDVSLVGRVAYRFETQEEKTDDL